jgi:hypothetical protein
MNTSAQMPDEVTLPEMRADIGTLIMVWCRVETSLAEAIGVLGGAPTHGISRKIDTWLVLHQDASRDRPEVIGLVSEVSAILRAALDLRNHIAHGLRSFDVGLSPEPHLITDLNGAPRRITVAEIRRTFDQLGILLSVIPDLSRIRRDTDDGKARERCAWIRENRPRLFDAA